MRRFVLGTAGLAAASLVGLVGVSVAGTATTVAKQSAAVKSAKAEKGTIALMFPNASQPVVVRIINVAKDEAKKRGYKFLVTDPGNDLNKQVGVIQTWIQQKVTAIESVAAEPQVFEKIASQAREAGIPWVTYAAKLKNEDGTVTWDHYKGGYVLGQEFARWLKSNPSTHGKAKVLLLTFEKGEWSRLRRQGIEAALKKYAAGRYEIVGKQDSLDAPSATSITSTVLQAHPDLNAVLCIIDTPCEGAYQALRNAGHAANDPKLFVGGLDGTEGAFKLIKQKTFYRASAAIRLYSIGKAVVDTPISIIQTHKPKNTIIPYVLITLRNPKQLSLYLSDFQKG